MHPVHRAASRDLHADARAARRPDRRWSSTCWVRRLVWSSAERSALSSKRHAHLATSSSGQLLARAVELERQRRAAAERREHASAWGVRAGARAASGLDRLVHRTHRGRRTVGGLDAQAAIRTDLDLHRVMLQVGLGGGYQGTSRAACAYLEKSAGMAGRRRSAACEVAAASSRRISSSACLAVWSRRRAAASARADLARSRRRRPPARADARGSRTCPRETSGGSPPAGRQVTRLQRRG